ncbi:MAG: efflux RND transporter periplasmic adaptor subunit [Rhodocyclaceae bacterium]|jgi:HlyD family secretion protein|nr:MAG: efflux RND transporter periplasmic adaptor subunit [Rhodocyclaceae bacterium]
MMNDTATSDAVEAAVLGTANSGPRWKRNARRIAVLALAAGIAAGIGVWLMRGKSAVQPSYITEPVTRGKLSVTVTANGTLAPTRTVNIGSELSGTVSRVLVDINDVVKKGQLLLELDTTKLRDQIRRSRASLTQAEARVTQSQATVREAQASLARLEEVARLSGGKVPSKAELDSGRATLDRAQADEAAARAAVADARAALSTDETNLAKASIRSPIDGTVLTRAVEPGNAVAASLQAVTLLTIAEDLSKLKLQVNVDEADVGMVKPGLRADFTVSAWPRRKFPASITRVAYGSTTTDNVVTYITYLDVDNPDLSLRPGMTATATLVAAERQDAMLVPNTALRFSPTQTATGKTGGTGSKPGNGIVASLVPRPPSGNAARRAANSTNTGSARQVWVLRDGQPVSIPITPGVSDGRMTEVNAPELQPGMEVITDQRAGAPQ